MTDPHLEDRVRSLEKRLAWMEARQVDVEAAQKDLTVKDVERILRISRTTIYRLMDPEDVEFDPTFTACSFKVGRGRRFDPKRLEEYRSRKTG